jgi:hypothetical protein
MKKAQNKFEIAGLPEQILPVAARSGAKFSHSPAASTASTGATETLLIRSLERARDMISLQALRLCDLRAESLHVVIKPGAGLELSLTLQTRGAVVDVLARLNHGDFHSLSRHWNELQRQLLMRGIRLAPLLPDEQIAGGRDETFRHAIDKRREDEARWAEAFAGLTSPRLLVVPPTPTRTKSSRGWESWD